MVNLKLYSLYEEKVSFLQWTFYCIQVTHHRWGFSHLLLLIETFPPRCCFTNYCDWCNYNHPDLCPVCWRGELSCIVHSDYCNCLHLHQPSCRDFLSPRGPLGHWRVILFPGAIHESLIGWNTGRALVFLNPPCRQLYNSNEIQAIVRSAGSFMERHSVGNCRKISEKNCYEIPSKYCEIIMIMVICYIGPVVRIDQTFVIKRGWLAAIIALCTRSKWDMCLITDNVVMIGIICHLHDMFTKHLSVKI